MQEKPQTKEEKFAYDDEHFGDAEEIINKALAEITEKHPHLSCYALTYMLIGKGIAGSFSRMPIDDAVPLAMSMVIDLLQSFSPDSFDARLVQMDGDTLKELVNTNPSLKLEKRGG